jgi:TonB family protein
MKISIIILLLSLLFITGFSQNLSYAVHSTYSHPVEKEKLNGAKSMSDIIPDYPASWMTDYISAEILTTINGKAAKAMSTNDMLTAEQINILHTVDLGSDIVVNITYKSKNATTDNIEINSMHFSVTVVPEIEAEYIGGNVEMTKYLKENAINKIPEAIVKDLQQAVVKFTINEKGEIANARLSKTSGDKKIDRLLLDAIKSMPQWRPAQNSKGIKVKQEFEFSVGNIGC